MMRPIIVIHQARWVIPMNGWIISQGAVAVAGDRILAVGPAGEIRRRASDGELGQGEVRYYDHGQGAIMPALINTHTHLEFSGLRQAIPPQTNLPDWLQAAISRFHRLTPEEIDQGVRQGIAEMRRFGVVLAGEVSNTGRSLPLLQNSPLEFHYFYECLGFNLLSQGPLEDDFPFLNRMAGADVPLSAAAHSPYAVSAPLFQRISAWNRRWARPGSVHLAESREERDFLSQGDGSFRELLIRRGRWYEGYIPPGCSAAVYLDRLGFWNESVLAVHGVWLDPQEQEILARRGVWLALCPRSNLYTGVGLPDLPALQRAGIKLTLGTDSLASVPDLNLFQEIKVLQGHFPEIPLPDIFLMTIGNGAAALNRSHDFGSLTPGKKAALLFLPLSSGAPLWPALLEAGVQGRISWLTQTGKEFADGN
ncbi:MAG: amidohydrolase family protein [Deltaproteobacteria bacterium]|nr:amidohydrolase family protein [Deltaproteobacteria bacterium]